MQGAREFPGSLLLSELSVEGKLKMFYFKEEDLCRAVAMADDMPTLLQRAIEKYDDVDLKPDGERALMNAKLFLMEYNKLHRQFSGALDELYEMSGLEIIDIGYDD